MSERALSNVPAGAWRHAGEFREISVTAAQAVTVKGCYLFHTRTHGRRGWSRLGLAALAALAALRVQRRRRFIPRSAQITDARFSITLV